MTYTEHTIITARNAEDLSARVTQAISIGWQPFQEITIAPNGLMHQAVVKGGDSEITTYQAIPARNVTDIVRAVAKAVVAGWQPFHEVVFAPDGLMLQAVIEGDPGTGGGSGDDITWGTLPGKPAVIGAGATQAAARQAIGAGTSNLSVGTSATDAKAGNWTPSWEEVGGKPAVIAAGATAEAARQAIGAGTSDFSGSFDDLTDKPTIPAAPTVDSLSGAGTAGKAVMKAADAEAARAAIGAGTGNSNLAIGTTAGTAKAGNYQPTWEEVGDKPAVIAAGATAAAARQAIGAGTSDLAIGTTATDAKAGNYQPTWAQVTGKPAVIGAGATAEAARQAIGAGTSNLSIGTTAADAKAGDWTPDAGVAVADATDETDVVPQLNALLASLRAAGFIAS